MKTLTHPELSKNLAKVLKEVNLGEEIVIKSDETQENIAVLISYKKYQENEDISTKSVERKLGLLKGKATYKIKKDFKITDEELLNL
ncbi:MAG: type II toxin-antitoxin system prevent-host-death family antitoxin [Balneolaceae bacterium]|nr:type II toxin-antitoxin system prevent-host-death family antitoxin [Balneolaceae bacterium]